jgi:protein TonB
MRDGVRLLVFIMMISSGGGAQALSPPNGGNALVVTPPNDGKALVVRPPNDGNAPVVTKYEPPGEPPKKLLGLPHWVHRPTGDDFVRVFPRGALEHGIEGHTTMRCKVTADGYLAECVITEETPRGRGFAEAALALAANFRVTPQTDAGEPVEGGTVVIPIGWKIKTRFLQR